MQTGHDIFQDRRTAEKDISLEYPGYSSLATSMLRHLGNIFTLEDYFALRPGVCAADYIENSRLAGAIGAYQPEYFAFINHEV